MDASRISTVTCLTERIRESFGSALTFQSLMQVYVLTIMVGVLVYSTGGSSMSNCVVPADLQLPAILIPYLLVLVAAGVVCGAIRRVVSYSFGDLSRILKRLDLALNILRWTTIVIFYVDLWLLGWFELVHGWMGDHIVIDKLITVAPAMFVPVAMWWLYYPVDRELRRLSISPQRWTRFEYVASQVRHQILLVMTPLVLIMAWSEVIDRIITQDHPLSDWHVIISFCGTLMVFAFTPLVMRFVWDTQPLEDGELRLRLRMMCKQYSVRVSELLRWNTHGSLINAAVMGIMGRVRYILLSDALLARMRDDHIEAICAHELGHVRRHHMIGLVVCALGTLSGIWLAIEGVAFGCGVLFGWNFLDALEYSLVQLDDPAVEHSYLWSFMLALVTMGSVIGMMIMWALVFGYVSRRFERQADTFAVQHLSRAYPDPTNHPDVVSSKAASIMIDALRVVAELNHIPITHRSWRHGSIAWRMAYIRSLIGKPIESPAIDRVVTWIFVAAGMALAVSLAYQYWMDML